MPPGASGYSGAHSAPEAHQAPSGGADGLADEVHTLERAIFEVKRIIVGQDQLVERMLVGLLSKGHVLLEGVPGVAKTLAVETFAKVVGGTFSRIQFTPDLVPTDIIGTRIYRQGKEEFDTELGPVVANFLLADEINRAPAKVQSALLEVMAERQVSIGGKRFPLPNPFLVMATQNPIEHEGVYQLGQLSGATELAGDGVVQQDARAQAEERLLAVAIAAGRQRGQGGVDAKKSDRQMAPRGEEASDAEWRQLPGRAAQQQNQQE